jgi:hypothetical protein
VRTLPDHLSNGKPEPFARLPHRILRDSTLTDSARLLFAALDRFKNKRSSDCFPSHARLAAEIGCSRWSVIRAEAELEAAGYLAVSRESGRPNRYELMVPICTGTCSSRICLATSLDRRGD